MRFLLTPVMLLLALPLVLSLSSETLSSESSPITIQYRVWEEQPAGTQVGCLLDDLRRSDEGGSLEDFQVLERGKALPFSVSTRDGVVSTQGRLDREQLCRGSDLCEVAFSVLYRKSGAVNCLRVRVEVMDLNDHSPSFPSALQEVEISETASLGMRIPLERAVDPDAGTNGLQAYTLSTSLHFVLEVTNAPAGIKQAELVVIKELDRELQDSFDLTMVAWDKGNPAKSGTTSIRVLIQDSNDNSPKFEDSYPTVTIPEDTALGTTIIKLRASDPDLGPNGEVDFLLSKLNLPAVQKGFYVDSQTGDLIVQAPLDYEVQSSYEVIIQAVDRGPNAIPAHCKVQVELMDVNDNAPRIHTAWTSDASDAATVMETAPVGTFVAMVTVNDADSGKNGEVSLAIKDVSVPFRLIKMYGNIYKVVTDGSLDREKVMHYNVTLLAQDHGSPLLVSVEQLGVSVLDDNDNAPVFSANIYRATLKENSAAENSILQLKAHDEDLGLNGRVSYYIGSQNEEIRHTHFTIHPRSGVIRVQQPLDYEERSSYSFIVGAVDHGHPPLTGTTTVQIEIEDVNDNHPVIKEPEPRKGVASVSIPVNAHKGEIVTEVGSEAEENPHVLPINPPSREEGFGFLASTIKAEDLDSGLNGKLQFFITEGNQFGLFWLDQATGQLYVNTTNVTELIGRNFRMGLRVSDMGTPTLDTTVTLEVAFINLKDHLRNSSPGNRGQLSFTMMIAICLGSTCLLLLLAIALVTTFCRPDKRDNRAYNCRQAESSYTRHPRRPQKSIRKSDIQLIPVIRGRKEEAAEDDGEAQPLTPPPLAEDQQPVATSYSTLRQGRNPSSSSSSGSHSSTLKRYKPEGKEKEHAASQATLRRPKMSAAQDAERQRMLRDLVRLSMVFGDSPELSSASPEVQQISQLLSLLRQGQLQPRPNFRGNKYSHRSGRYGGQDGSDWQSTKDSGHGESEAGDVDWEPGRESPIDPQIEEGLHNLLNNPDGVFSQDCDPSWMARLSVPLTADYHDNVFVPDQPPSSETDNLARGGLSSSSSFSTFGKTPEKDGPLGGALLSEVSTLFEMLMTQKADAHPGPRPDVLYRLSAAYRRSVGLNAAAATHSRPPHKPAPHD
uniref:Protocadherin 12 n=1 Tax=Oryzias latipes TaxID=8090 RepID=A0A3P9L3V1_ORYLA